MVFLQGLQYSNLLLKHQKGYIYAKYYLIFASIKIIELCHHIMSLVNKDICKMGTKPHFISSIWLLHTSSVLRFSTLKICIYNNISIQLLDSTYYKKILNQSHHGLVSMYRIIYIAFYQGWQINIHKYSIVTSQT